LGKEDISKFLYAIEANVVVFVNGIFSKELSNILSPVSELEITEIKNAEKSITEKYFARNTYSSVDGLYVIEILPSLKMVCCLK